MKTPIIASKAATQLIAGALAFLLIAASCGSSGDDAAADEATTDETATTEDSGAEAEVVDDADAADTDTDTETETETETETDTDGTVATSAVDVSLFFDGAIVGDVTTEDCTLSGGAETSCYVITVAGDPVSYDTGPFCPTSISDGAEAGGIWFDGNGVYDLDGDFIADLAELYGDDNWQMFDEDGNVFVTETAEEFDLAARPDVDPSVQNHCVEGRLEWLENGEAVTSTVAIPVQPVLADSAGSSNGNLGVTLDGVVIAQSAPVDAILSAYTIAAFDDCGGHYNPVDGYHVHGATGCSELADTVEGETAMFAYAMDGFPVHSPIEDTSDLDECNGHETEELGYHYHANSAEQNLVIECLIGQVVAGAGDAGGGGGGERPAGPPPGEEE